MTVKNIKYKVFDLVEEKNELEKKMEELKEAHIKLLERIKSVCHHPAEHVERREYYFDGSYLDQAYTDYWNQCTLCGTKSETTTQNHSWYG